MCGGLENDKIIETALSIEMFQTGILMHDDIIDNGETRRNKPSAYMRLGGNHFGKSMAICLGDLGFPFANELILNSDFKEEYKIKALKYMNNIFFGTIYGEIMDVDFTKNNNIEEKEIIDMYTLKTAYYTITGPLQIGAALAGASEDILENIKKFGTNAGIMFQIKDDILGIYSEEEMVGKSTSSDIREGKNTLLSKKALKFSDEKTQQKIKSIYGANNNVNKEDIEYIRNIFSNTGAKAECEKEILKYYENAFTVINDMTNDEKAREIIIDLLKYLKERDK